MKIAHHPRRPRRLLLTAVIALFALAPWLATSAPAVGSPPDVRAAAAAPDRDDDGVPDGRDNCPNVSNGGQADADADYLGNACDPDSAPAALPRCHDRPVTITGTRGDDVLTGTPGRDVILGLDGDDTITGLGGDDRICAGPGRDTARGGGGKDFVEGGTGGDWLDGGGGNDRIDGSGGTDVLLGGFGNDWLDGGPGVDQMNGGPGRDTLIRQNQ